MQQKEVAALIGDSTQRLREALTAKASPDVVGALDANLQATKAPRLPQLEGAAENYIVGAYHYLLGMTPDPGGLQSYGEHLRTGTRTRETMLAPDATLILYTVYNRLVGVQGLRLG